METEDFEFTGQHVDIPWEWSAVVCACLNPKYDREFPAPTDNSRCVQCGMLARWQLLQCTGCDEHYIYVFKHHARALGLMMGQHHMVRDRDNDGWAVDKNLCWTCICDTDPAVEGDKPPVYVEPPPVRSLDEILEEGFEEFPDYE